MDIRLILSAKIRFINTKEFNIYSIYAVSTEAYTQRLLEILVM
jgi:hypothetical protein